MGYIAKSGGVVETAELTNTITVDDSENGATIANVRRYIFLTLPTTNKWYIITGIGWKNGTVVNGNVFGAVEAVDANPPVAVNVNLLGFMQSVAQTGTNAAQRSSVVSSMPIRGGTTIGVWIESDSATSKFRLISGQTSINCTKAIAGAVDMPNGNLTAWGVSTSYSYINVYYRGI